MWPVATTGYNWFDYQVPGPGKRPNKPPSIAVQIYGEEGGTYMIHMVQLLGTKSGHKLMTTIIAVPGAASVMQSVSVERGDCADLGQLHLAVGFAEEDDNSYAY